MRLTDVDAAHRLAGGFAERPYTVRRGVPRVNAVCPVRRVWLGRPPCSAVCPVRRVVRLCLAVFAAVLFG